MTKRLVAILTTGLLALSFGSPPAHGAGGEVAFAVTPSRLVLEIEPGQSSASSIRVYNRSDTTLRLRTEIGKAEIPRSDLIGDDELAFTAQRWLQWEHATIEVPPRDFTDVVLRAEVPADGTSGGYHALAYLQSVSTPSNSTGVVGAARIGVSVLVNVAVAGVQIERSTQVSDMDVHVRWHGLFRSSVETSTTVENTGDTHAFIGGVHTYRLWPGSASAQKKVGPYTLLRGTRHTLVSSWGTPLFGRVTVTSEIAYQRGPGDVPAVVMQKTVWIIPWRLIALLLALVVAGVMILVRRRRRGSAGDMDAAPPPVAPPPAASSTPSGGDALVRAGAGEAKEKA